MEFLGKPMDYWLALDLDIKEMNAENMVHEIAKLRSKVSFYEARVNELNTFMQINLEIKPYK